MLYRGKSGRTEPGENPQLQYAYESRGNEKEILNRLEAAHEEMQEWVTKNSSIPVHAFETELILGGNDFFSLHYPGGAGD